MKSVTPWIVVASCLILVVLLICGYLQPNPFAAIAPEAVHQSTPISLAEARQQLSIALPEGASNIQYSGYSEFIAYEFLLKFEAPLEVCKSHALLLVKGDALEPISDSPEAITPTSPLKPDWFDVENIEEGYVVGDGHQLRAWIDSDRELMYFMRSD